MHLWHRISRVALTLMAVAIVASVSVSAAEAGYGRGRGYGNARYKGGYGRGYGGSWYSGRVIVSRPVRYYRPAYGVYHVGRPVSGGYLAFGSGGVSLGFALSNQPYGYGYVDPYCNTRFSSLAAYQDHCRVHRHEVVVRVIHENAYPDDRYDDRGYDNRGYDNRGYDNPQGPNDDSYDDPTQPLDRPDWNGDDNQRRDWNDPGDDNQDDGGGR